jgi:hypothetical protein
MLATEARPTGGTVADVYCRHCGYPRPLARVSPGTLWLRHKGLDQRVTGLTPQQRVYAKCGGCGRVQEILVPEGSHGTN